MVALIFDATAARKVEVTVTLGRSKTEMRWSDRRTMAFDDFAALLTKPAVGPKDGTCYTPAVFRLPQRKMDHAEQIDVAVLDADCGHTAEEIIAAVSAKGWQAVVHSTFSHLTAHTEISCSAYDKWREAAGKDDPAGYMLEKKGYLSRVTDGAKIVDERGGNYIFEHAPCPKFRIVLPLDRPWLASDHADQNIANATWRVRILGLAAALGLHSDQSCTDTSRLFYFPRLKNADQPFFSQLVPGDLCDIWSIPDAEAQPDQDLFAARPVRASASSVIRPTAVSPGDKTFRSSHGDGAQINLTHWAVSHGGRFEIERALRTRMPAAFGNRVGSSVKHHIQCPFDDEHTHANDRTGSFVVNASQIGRAGLTAVTSGFYIGCKHNSCTGRDRLDHLAKILEKGWLSVADLSNPDFLKAEEYDLSPADTTAFLAKIEGQEVTAPIGGTPYGNIPASLFNDLPGVIGDTYRYILANSVKEQPVLALGATLAMMGAAVGRKCCVEGWGTRPNVFICAIAVSGAGKSAPINGVKEIISRSGHYNDLVGAEKIISSAGIISEVFAKKSHVMLINEIGFALQAMSNARDAHMGAVVPLLLQLYDASKEIFKNGSYADASKTSCVVQPCISLFGATTPDKLYQGLSTEDIRSGLLSRIVIFDAGEHDPEESKPRGAPVPETTVEWIKTWWEARTNDNPLETSGAMEVVNPPVKIGFMPEAEAAFATFRREMHLAKGKARETGADTLYARAHENALKFAMLYAVANGPDRAIITLPAARWGITLSRATTEHMHRIADSHIADSIFQRNISAFRDAIQKAGSKGATAAELGRRKTCQLPARERDAVLTHLQQTEEVVFVNTNEGKQQLGGGPVKARNAYVWVTPNMRESLNVG